MKILYLVMLGLGLCLQTFAHEGNSLRKIGACGSRVLAIVAQDSDSSLTKQQREEIRTILNECSTKELSSVALSFQAVQSNIDIASIQVGLDQVIDICAQLLSESTDDNAVSGLLDLRRHSDGGQSIYLDVAIEFQSEKLKNLKVKVIDLTK